MASLHSILCDLITVSSEGECGPCPLLRYITGDSTEHKTDAQLLGRKDKMGRSERSLELSYIPPLHVPGTGVALAIRTHKPCWARFPQPLGGAVLKLDLELPLHPLETPIRRERLCRCLEWDSETAHTPGKAQDAMDSGKGLAEEGGNGV